MKTPIILAGLAAVLLLGSKSTTKSEKKSSKPDFGLKNNETCTELEYKDKSGSCIAFWIDGETDKFVLDEINDQIKKLNDQSFENICAGKQIEDKYMANDNLIQIIKNTIVKLWPSINLSDLPPKVKSPDWLKTIWKKTNYVYYSKICSDENAVT